MIQADVSEPAAPLTAGGRFLLLTVRFMVDRPMAVRVVEVVGSQSVVLEVMVDRSDYKRVVGRRGRTAEALRDLLLNIGGKENRHYILEIVDPSRRMEEVPARDWGETQDEGADGPALPASEDSDD
jgi:hypothetical protein